MERDAIDWLTDRVLGALAHDEPIEPAALLLLVARYVETGRDDLRDAIGPALAHAIDLATASETPDLKVGPAYENKGSHETAMSYVGPSFSSGASGATSIDRRAEWLTVFVEAAAIADDERLDEAIGTLVRSLHDAWPSGGDVWSAMQSIDACLSAARRLANTGSLVPAAVDELERIVGIAYEPGEGLLRTLRPRSDDAGGLREHVAAASALLSAYAIAGRLPYSMLAEELIQFARRLWWHAARGGFWRIANPATAAIPSNPANAANPSNLANPANPDLFLWNCQAARVLCRLAALHQDPEYRAVAVIAHESDYADDAKRTLESLEPGYRERGLDAAIYGVALGEWLAMR